MGQKELKSSIFSILCVFSVAALALLAGCTDNPEDKASKQTHQQVQKAIAQSDIAAAQEQVQSAIATYRPAGLAQDSATWVNGSLMLQQALALKAELPAKTAPLDQAVASIASLLVQSEQWLLEKERIESMLTLGEREMTELSALLAGTADNPGFQKRLTDAQAALSELQTQRKTIEQEHTAALAVLAQRQSKADALLRQADVEKGDRQLALRQQAYELLLGGKDEYVHVQSLENKLGLMDGQIALAVTQEQMLAQSAAHTQQKLASLETAEARPMLKSQLAEIEQLLADRRQRIYMHADALKAALDAYLQAAQEIGQMFEDAAAQFEQVRSAEAGFAAAFRQADSLTYAGVTLGEKMQSVRRLALRLNGIIGAADPVLARGLAERLPMSAELNPQELERFNAFFAAADEAYLDASTKARRIPKAGQETACTVLKSHILSVHAKMTLADAMKLFDVANQTQTRLEELKKEGEEFGSLFTLSTTARLLDKGLDFVPSLPVNVELYFEGIRQRFAEWKRLETPQQQAELVERNLVEMEDLIKTYGDAMAQLLEPIKQEMLTAKQQGFVTPGAEQPPSDQTQTEPQPQEEQPMMMPGMPMMPGPEMPAPQPQ